MRYQNMYLPFCSDDGKHFQGSPEFCTLTAFGDGVKELTLIEWDAECAPSGRLPRISNAMDGFDRQALYIIYDLYLLLRSNVYSG